MTNQTFPTDVQKCRSLLCLACNQFSSVTFVTVQAPSKINGQCELTLSDVSEASTAPSSFATSQRTLTPASSISMTPLEIISSLGEIHDHSFIADDKSDDELKLNVPYKLTRAKSKESLDRFIASIESASEHIEEEDVDELMFGTPWNGKL